MITIVPSVSSEDDSGDQWHELSLSDEKTSDEKTSDDALQGAKLVEYRPVFPFHRAKESKQNTKDIKVAVGVALLVLGVLAVVAALVLTFAFAIPFIHIVLTITLVAAGSLLTGIALLVYSVCHKKKK